MKKIVRYKSREEWVANRSLGIGASEVGTMLGINEWETPYQLWRRKKGLDAPKVETFAMKAGHYLEDAVSRFFSDETGAHIIKNTTDDFTIYDPSRPWLRVSPDRLYWREGRTHSDKYKSVLECKTTQLNVDEYNLPRHWFCQLQMNMGVGGYEDGALAWLVQGRTFGYRNIEFDPLFYAWMTERVTEWWQRYIIGDEEPPITTADDVMLKYPRHAEGKEVLADTTIAKKILDLKELKNKMKQLEEDIDELANTIRVFFADAEAIVDGSGKVLATYKAKKNSMRFDLKEYEENTPEDERAKFYHEVPGARTLLIK